MLELIIFTISGFICGIIVAWIYLGETTRQMIQDNMNLMHDVGELNNQKLSLLKDLERMCDGLQVKGNKMICTRDKPKPNFVGEEKFCLHCDGCGIVNNKVCNECNGHGCVIVNKYGVYKYTETDEQIHAAQQLGGFA